MKILDKYLLKQFISTFTTVFVILFFIFILQTVWLFISELAGKNLDFISVVKFLLFAMPRVVPLVLPLSVLLASIMTFGSLAENYEFAAMKSSGISLQRSMKHLTVFILLLSIVAFIFANNVIPYAEYKFINFRRNIAQLKPAMAIAEGQFSEIGNYTIKVEKKSGDEGRYLDKVTIHKRANLSTGNNTIIKADKGELVSSKNSNVLKLILKDGNYYEDIIPKKYEERKKIPFAKSEFDRYVINIDLSKLNEVNTDDEQITNTNTMLTVGELNYTLDSLSKNYEKDLVSYVDNISQRTGMTNEKYAAYRDVIQDSVVENKPENKLENNSVLMNFNDGDKHKILSVTSSTIESNMFSIEGSKYEMENKIKNINMHWIALYDKFVIAFSCILMFFIGAPLGAIIRKGGLGLPIVFAVAIFIVFHFVNTFGKKMAQENGITPFIGCWLSTIILLPLAIFLTKRATDDKGATIQMDWLTDFFIKLFGTKSKKEVQFKKEIVSLDSIEIDLNNEEINSLNALDSSTLKNFVKNSDQFGYTTEQRLTALKILETRGINQEELLLTNSLYNTDYLKLTYYVQLFKNQSNMALIFYVLSFVFSVAFSESFNTIILVLGLLNTLLMYMYIFKSGQCLTEIMSITKRNNFVNIYLALLLGFPFFIFIYLYNKKQLQETLSEFNS